MYRFIAIFLILTACNSVYMKPGTMEPKTTVHAKLGGVGMERAVKEQLEKRGYDVRVGKQRKIGQTSLSSSNILELPKDIKYIVRVDPNTETFMPWWCMFNGVWWWRFSVSITDQKTGTEILSWRGRGCQNSSLRKLNDILDKLEHK